MREIRSLRLVALLFPALAWGQSAQFNLSQFAHNLSAGGNFLNPNALTTTTCAPTPTAACQSIAWGGGFSGSYTGGTIAATQFVLSPDTVANTSSNNPLVSAFEVDHNFGSSTFQGLAEGQQITLVMTSATGNTTPIASQYSVLGLTGQANTSDGGTGGTPKGSLYGFNPNVRILGAVQNWNFLNGGEIDIAAFSGSTLAKKIGLQIVQTTADAVSGSLENLGYVLANGSGATGWAVGLSFGNYDGNWPITSGGTLIGCYPHANAGSCGTSAIGIDFSNVVLTSNFLKSTGFTVDGAGNEVANAINNTPIGGTTPAAVTGTVVTANNVELAASQSAAGNGIYNSTAGNEVDVTVGGAKVGSFTSTGLNNTVIGSTTSVAGTFTGLTNVGTGAVNLSNGISIAASGGIVQMTKPIVSAGAAFTVASGTGACATTGSVTGGRQAGQFSCTGSTGASTVTLTLLSTSNAYTCWGRDISTPTTVTQTGATSATSVTLTLTSVSTNDVLQVGCLGY